MLGKQRTELGALFSWGVGGRPERLLTGPEAERPAGLAGVGCALKQRGGPQSPPRVNCGLLGFAGQELVRRSGGGRSTPSSSEVGLLGRIWA